MADKIIPAFIQPDKQRTWTEGVATTGQISPKGTVTHTETFGSERVDAVVRPATVSSANMFGQSATRIQSGSTLTFVGEVTI